MKNARANHMPVLAENKPQVVMVSLNPAATVIKSKSFYKEMLFFSNVSYPARYFFPPQKFNSSQLKVKFEHMLDIYFDCHKYKSWCN